MNVVFTADQSREKEEQKKKDIEECFGFDA